MLNPKDVPDDLSTASEGIPRNVILILGSVIWLLIDKITLNILKKNSDYKFQIRSGYTSPHQNQYFCLQLIGLFGENIVLHISQFR